MLHYIYHHREICWQYDQAWSTTLPKSSSSLNYGIFATFLSLLIKESLLQPKTLLGIDLKFNILVVKDQIIDNITKHTKNKAITLFKMMKEVQLLV